MNKAYLVLSDGTVYEGEGFGAEATSVGELVFNTGVVGYIEMLTDPSYAGQIVMQTFPLSGNYGVIESDFEGDCHVHGFVAREWCDTPSNFRAEYTLDKFLKDRGIPGICGVDTRAITRKVRDEGVMGAMICAEVPSDLSSIRDYKVSGMVEKATCGEKRFHAACAQKYHAALVDYGMKKYIVDELVGRGCSVTIVPASAAAEEILALNPDGIVLSAGPGDPAENGFCIEQIGKLMGKAPVFGYGLGHQMAALAMGAKTEKMKPGHRGGNQPVRELSSGRTYITSQNHGYCVASDSVTKGTVSFVSANDGSCEGIDYPELNAFTVQFEPESQSGPRSTAFLFDRFMTMMGGDR